MAILNGNSCTSVFPNTRTSQTANDSIPSLYSHTGEVAMYNTVVHCVMASACHDVHSGISLPRYYDASTSSKIFYLLLLFSPAFCNSCFPFFVALPCTSSGLPFFANIMHSSINNTLLLTTLCDLNRVFNVITNKYQWCYVLIFTYRRFSVFLDILIMRCDGW